MPHPHPPAPLAITMGDPAGVGPEIIVKALLQAPPLAQQVCVVGDMAVMQRAQHTVAQHCPSLRQAAQALRWQAVPPFAHANPPPIQRQPLFSIHLWQIPVDHTDTPTPGCISAHAARMAETSIRMAAQATLHGDFAALVTAPIHKEALALAGVPYPGHTEMLQALAAHHAGVPAADMPVRMMLANPELKTVLNSVHVSLRQAMDAVTPEQVLQTILMTHHFLHRTVAAVRHGQRAPIVAVAGLNPHAGEGGLFGREDIDIIAPAIAAARQQGVDARGPYPPDTVFMQARQQHNAQPPFADAVVAMYHDQGLIAVKYLGIEHGVNITLGLPLIRTSPDHGTAFDLAGTGQANATSLLHALRMAQEMTTA